MAPRSQLARQLRAYCLLLGAAALCWLAWRWDASRVQALVGAALVFFGGPIVLGVEFLFLRALDRSPGVPRPSAAHLLHAWFKECIHFYRVFCWRQPFRWRAAP